MSGKTVLQSGDAIIRRAGLRYIRTLTADCSGTLTAWPHDRDMSGFIVMMIAVSCNNQVTTVRVVLRIDSVANRLPALLCPFVREPFELGIRQQYLRMFGWTQNVNAELLRRGRNERAAVRVLADTGFGLAVGLTGLPMHVLAGWPMLLHVQRVDRGDQPLRLRTYFFGNARGRAQGNSERHEKKDSFHRSLPQVIFGVHGHSRKLLLHFRHTGHPWP